MTEQDIIDICKKLGVKYIDGFLTYSGLLIGHGLDGGRVEVIREGYCDDTIKFEKSLKMTIVRVKEFKEKQKIREMEADFE